MAGADLVAAIIVVAAIWVVLAAVLAILAAKRLRRAQSVLGAARAMRSLLDAAPARALLVHADDKIEPDSQLVRELELLSAPRRLSDLSGDQSGFVRDDLEALIGDIENVRLGASAIRRQLKSGR